MRAIAKDARAAWLRMPIVVAVLLVVGMAMTGAGTTAAAAPVSCGVFNGTHPTPVPSMCADVLGTECRPSRRCRSGCSLAGFVARRACTGGRSTVLRQHGTRWPASVRTYSPSRWHAPPGERFLRLVLGVDVSVCVDGYSTNACSAIPPTQPTRCAAALATATASPTPCLYARAPSINRPRLMMKARTADASRGNRFGSAGNDRASRGSAGHSSPTSWGGSAVCSRPGWTTCRCSITTSCGAATMTRWCAAW